MESKLYKVLKVKIKDINKESIDNTIHIQVKDKELRKKQTLIKDNEITRIIKCLDLDNNSTKCDGYIFIKDIISVTMKVSDYEKSNGHMKVTYKKRFENYIFESEILYKRLLASSGNVRSKKVIFIRENLWSKANDILLCGMPSDMEYDFFSKFNAYYALANTDSDVVTTPRIVVINDYEKDITENFDIVREVGRNKYKVENNEPHTERIKPFDGAGLCDIHWASKVAMVKLKLNYIPSTFQFRVIPGIKGNVYTFNIGKFAKEHNKTYIIDAWNKRRPIFDKKGRLLIDVLLTKSQFKFFKKYNSFEEWQRAFNTETYGYRRTFNISHYSVSFDKIKDKTLLSYQPLQSLNLNQTQIESLCEKTVNTITQISTNVDEFLKYRGLLEEVNEDGEVIEDYNKTLVPSYYKALQQNKDLFNDEYIQEKIQADIEGFKERSYKGAIYCEGNYQTFIPDIVGLAEYAFGDKEPKGCLKANEIYCRYWLANNAKKVGIVRFPHIAREWRIGQVVNPKTDYLRYMTEGIVTSMFDTIALALNSADYDGDKILTISTNKLIEQAEKEIANTITFIPRKKVRIYNIEDIALNKKHCEHIHLKELPKRRKKKVYKINKNEPKQYKIDNMNKIIKTDCMAMGNNIGKVVNKISKLWMLVGEAKDKEKETIYDYIKIMSVIGSLTIDFVKTGVKAPIPKEIEEYLKDINKPSFMKVKYKDQVKKESKINKNNKILNVDPVELFSDKDCTMNRIYHHMKNKVDKISFDKGDTAKIEFTNLIKSKKINTYNESYKQVFQMIMKLKVEYNKVSQENVFDKEFLQDKKTEDDYKWRLFYSYCRNELLSICANKKLQLDIEQLLDYVIHIHYKDEKFTNNNDSKAILWNVFGGEINKRIKNIDLDLKELDIDKLNKRIKKLKNSVKKQKKQQEQVYIKMFEPMDKDIEIYESEIKHIKKEVIGFEKRKMMFVLLILQKFSAAYTNNNLVKIYINKKNTINKTHILKLTKIDKRKYDDMLMMLNKLEFINLGVANQGELLTCKIEDIEISGEKYIIRNINDCKKYFKKFK